MTVYFVVIVLWFASGVHLVGSFHYGYHLNNQTGTTYSKVVFYLWLGLISFENMVFTGNQSIKYFVAIPSLISCSWHITIWLIFLILIIRPLLSWESTSHQYAPICEVIEFIDTLFSPSFNKLCLPQMLETIIYQMETNRKAIGHLWPTCRISLWCLRQGEVRIRALPNLKFIYRSSMVPAKRPWTWAQSIWSLRRWPKFALAGCLFVVVINTMIRK